MKASNHCQTCDFFHFNDSSKGWCYMFKDPPDSVCYKHSGRDSRGFERRIYEFLKVFDQQGNLKESN